MATFLAKITNGEMDFGSDFNRARFREFAKQNEGKWIRIEKPVSYRTLNQNALYWAWLSKVEYETGNVAEEMHEFFKEKFLPKRLARIKGKKNTHDVELCGTTKKLNTIEFGEYLDRCSAYCEVALPTDEELAEMGYIKN